MTRSDLGPRIAITMGDPAGVGPELCLRVLDAAASGRAWRPVLVGDVKVLREVARKCPQLPQPSWRCMTLDQYRASADAVAGPIVVDLDALRGDVQGGRVTARTATAAYAYITTAIDLALRGEADGIATGPIHKEALRGAGIRQPGHTEILAEKTATERYCMMLTSDALTCSFVTTHVGYADVPGLLTEDRIVEVAQLTVAALQRIRGRPPRLVICGLNPHAGEHGLFGGGEEETIIDPAVRRLRAAGVQIEGPVPPDTAFLRERRETTDGYICMYHDQGHIPLKALAFDEAVNITLGLPLVRTSVDHGTALDIAWQGKARPTSFLHAVKLAAQLAVPRAASASPAPASEASRRTSGSIKVDLETG